MVGVPMFIVWMREDMDTPTVNDSNGVFGYQRLTLRLIFSVSDMCGLR